MSNMGPKLAKKVKKLDDETLLAMYRDIQKEEQQMKDKKEVIVQDEPVK